LLRARHYLCPVSVPASPLIIGFRPRAVSAPHRSPRRRGGGQQRIGGPYAPPPSAPVFPNHRRATLHVLAAGAFTNRCTGALHGDAIRLRIFDRLVPPDKIQTRHFAPNAPQCKPSDPFTDQDFLCPSLGHRNPSAPGAPAPGAPPPPPLHPNPPPRPFQVRTAFVPFPPMLAMLNPITNTIPGPRFELSFPPSLPMDTLVRQSLSPPCPPSLRLEGPRGNHRSRYGRLGAAMSCLPGHAVVLESSGPFPSDLPHPTPPPTAPLRVVLLSVLSTPRSLCKAAQGFSDVLFPRFLSNGHFLSDS